MLLKASAYELDHPVSQCSTRLSHCLFLRMLLDYVMMSRTPTGPLGPLLVFPLWPPLFRTWKASQRHRTGHYGFKKNVRQHVRSPKGQERWVHGMYGLYGCRTGSSGVGVGLGGWTLTSRIVKLLSKMLPNASTGAALFHREIR